METIKIANLEGLIEYVNKNSKPLKIVSGDNEVIIIDTQTWNRWEQILEDVENIRLLELTQNRKSCHFTSFDDLIAKEGFDFDEIKELAKKVIIE